MFGTKVKTKLTGLYQNIHKHINTTYSVQQDLYTECLLY